MISKLQLLACFHSLIEAFLLFKVSPNLYIKFDIYAADTGFYILHRKVWRAEVKSRASRDLIFFAAGEFFFHFFPENFKNSAILQKNFVLPVPEF